MDHRLADGDGVNARILYWGIEQAGKSTNLHAIQAKLRADHRGELKQVPTRLDPTVHYEVLPISLGEVNGVHTQIQVIAVPGSHEHEPTRKQLLDCVDGVVLVVDARPECLEDNVASADELRESLGAYGRRLGDLPLVVQYNKRDLVDSFTLEALHRRLETYDAPVFESVAVEGSGVLQTLTTISKRVIRSLRDVEHAASPEQPVIESPTAADGAGLAPLPGLPAHDPLAQSTADPALAAESRATLTDPLAPLTLETDLSLASEGDLSLTGGSDLLEDAILAEATDVEGARAAAETAFEAASALNQPWEELSADSKPSEGVRIGADLEIVSVGVASQDGSRGVRVPLVLGNSAGETVTLTLSVQLDPLLDDGDA